MTALSPSVLTFPPLALATFEKRYRTDHAREHALLLDADSKLIVYRSGDAGSVDFSPEELVRAEGGLLSHNHPHGKPPSKFDVALALRYGLTIRAFGLTPDGENWDYTIRPPGASAAASDYVLAHYDDQVEQAERGLAARADQENWSDWKWERESRNLAIVNLAKMLGFAYDRTRRSVPIAEMTRRDRQSEDRRLAILVGLETTMRNQVFAPLASAIAATLSRHAGVDNRVAAYRLETIRREIARHVQQTMLGGPDASGVLTPYSVVHNEVRPRSVYFRTLWTAMRAAAAVSVEKQADLMRRYLPPDLVRLFEMATLSPFDTAVQEDESDLPTQGLGPDFGQGYDPLHRWIGQDGKQLSDRIWNATGDMGRKLDLYLTQAITRGESVQQMARDLEQYLVPGRKSRVDTPWGNMSADAMRLARTEVASAGHRADYAAARLNPLVETYSPFTAPRHQCCDECDDEERGGPYPVDDPTHLPTFHPNCICGVIWHIVEDVTAAVDSLREQIMRAIAQARRSIADFIGPLSKRLLDLLFRGRL